jgi:hypothetical protein
MPFPNSNLPATSQPWARDVQKRVESLESNVKANEINNTARDVQLETSYKRLDKAVNDLIVADAAITIAVDQAQQAADDAAAAASLAQSAIDGLGSLDEATSTYKLNASNLTAGTINASIINVTNINANNITSGAISADRIDAGTIDSSNINITSGSYSLNVGNSGMAAYLNVSPSSSNGVSLNRVGFVSISTAGWWSNMYPYLNNDVYCGLAAYAWAGIRSVTAVVVTSDERTKNSITDSDLGLDFIESLRPVSYKFNVGRNETTFDEAGEISGSIEHPGRRKHYGLVAQEVKQSLDQFDVDDFGGWVLDDVNDPESPQALRYEEFISPLIKAVQELSAKVKQLEGA